MSTWQTLGTLDEYEAASVLMPPIIYAAVVVIILLEIICVIRYVRCRKTRGLTILKVRPTKLGAINYGLAAVFMITTSFVTITACAVFVAKLTALGSDSLFFTIFEQIKDISYAVLAYYLIFSLSIFTVFVQSFFRVFHSFVICENGLMALDKPTVPFVPWSQIKRAVWFTPNKIRIDLVNGSRKFPVHANMVDSVNEALGHFTDVVDYQMFKAGGKKAYPRSRYRFQFRLRTLLLITLLFAIFSADIGTRLQKLLNIKRIIAQLTESGASVDKYGLCVYSVDWDSNGSNQPTDNDLALLEEIGNVYSISICGPNVSHDGLQHISTLTTLQSLWLDGTTGITGEGIKYLAPLQRLDWLFITGVSIDDGGLKQIGKLKNLNYLSIDPAQITDEGLVSLAELPKLNILSLNNLEASGLGLKHLTKLHALRHLYLRRSQINDEGLQQIGKLKNLECLVLEGTQITDDGLMHLKGLKNLEYLSLKDTKITNKGLVHLKQLPKLRRLDLTGTSATDAAAKKILPDADIEFSSANASTKNVTEADGSQQSDTEEP